MSPLNITQPLDSIRYMVYNGYYKVMSNIPKSWDIYQPLTVWILKSLRGFLEIGAVFCIPFPMDFMDGLHQISRSVQVVLVPGTDSSIVNPMGNPISFQDFLGTTPLIRVLALEHWKDLRKKKTGKCWSDQANHVEPIWPYVFFFHPFGLQSLRSLKMATVHGPLDARL